MNTIIGKCSICGGNVTVPSVYHSITPPVPTCDSCGAIGKDEGKVIQMKQRRTRGLAR
jgi:hypothetical protein